MRHRVKGNKLGRTYSHRLATLKSLATSLILHKKIKTTVAKAKEAKVFIEPLITKAKVDSVANRRYVARFIKDKEALKMLFGEVREKVLERNGGYLRVVKLGSRRGDGADLAILELVDYNLVEKPGKKSTVKSDAKATSNVNTAATENTTNVEEAKVVETEESVKAEDTTENKDKE